MLKIYIEMNRNENFLKNQGFGNWVTLAFLASGALPYSL